MDIELKNFLSWFYFFWIYYKVVLCLVVLVGGFLFLVLVFMFLNEVKRISGWGTILVLLIENLREGEDVFLCDGFVDCVITF